MISSGMPLAAGTPLVTSRTSQVYALGEHHVVKLYPTGQEAAAECEFAAAQLVHALGVPSPALVGTTTEHGRMGIVYARLRGQSLQSWLGLRRPWRARLAGHLLAEVHTSLHAYRAPALPALRDHIARGIQDAAPLSAATRAHALEALDALDALDAAVPRSRHPGDCLCHGDLTAENILLTDEGPMVIDWAEAMRGDPAADIALTLLHLEIAHVYYRPQRRALAWAANHLLLDAYQDALLLLCPQLLRRARQWLFPVTAARLARGAPVPPGILLGLLRRYTPEPRD